MGQLSLNYARAQFVGTVFKLRIIRSRAFTFSNKTLNFSTFHVIVERRTPKNCSKPYDARIDPYCLANFNSQEFK